MNAERLLEIHQRLDAVRLIDRAVRVYKDSETLWCPAAHVRDEEWSAAIANGAGFEPMTREQALRHRARHMARVQDLAIHAALDLAGDAVKVLTGAVMLRVVRERKGTKR